MRPGGRKLNGPSPRCQPEVDALALPVPVCRALSGVLTFETVPWYARSRSVPARIAGFRVNFPGERAAPLCWETAFWAGVAQLVEHLICNQRVGGSNPFASSTSRKKTGPERQQVFLDR